MLVTDIELLGEMRIIDATKLLFFPSQCWYSIVVVAIQACIFAAGIVASFCYWR